MSNSSSTKPSNRPGPPSATAKPMPCMVCECKKRRPRYMDRYRPVIPSMSLLFYVFPVFSVLSTFFWGIFTSPPGKQSVRFGMWSVLEPNKLEAIDKVYHGCMGFVMGVFLIASMVRMMLSITLTEAVYWKGATPGEDVKKKAGRIWCVVAIAILYAAPWAEVSDVILPFEFFLLAVYGISVVYLGLVAPRLSQHGIAGRRGFREGRLRRLFVIDGCLALLVVVYIMAHVLLPPTHAVTGAVLSIVAMGHIVAFWFELAGTRDDIGSRKVKTLYGALLQAEIIIGGKPVGETQQEDVEGEK